MIRTLALVAIAGCLEHVELASDSLPGLVSIDVSPPQDTLLITLPSSRQTVAYTALGHFVDGTSRDITADLTWTTDNPAPGAFATPGTYTSSNAAGGHVAVRASHDAIAATAELTVRITATIVDDGFPPPGSGLFDPGTPTTPDAMKSPVIAYPANATLFPQGLAAVLFQYTHGMATDAYRLTFESDVLDLTILTGSDRWRPDDDTWALIARSHPSATVMFEVDAAASMNPGTIWTGAAEQLGFAANDPGGVLFYGAKKAVLRTTLGATSAAKQYPPAGDATPTVDEAISLGGLTMAVAYGGHMQVVDLATSSVVATSNAPMGWAAVSPDGRLVVVANMGMLQLRDAATGQGVGSPDGHFDVGGMATHPDWSPDGTQIAVAIGSMVTNDDLKGGAIARVPYLGNGAWGSPQIVVASANDNDNNYFPKWSPDGSAIAYVHAAEPAKDALTAELRLVAVGGGTPVALARASHQLATGSVAMLADAMPAWAPAGATAWLMFTSARPYGVVHPMLGGSQIWVAGVDLAAAGDPSWSAFWLPAQDITAPTTTPAWAPVIVTTD